MLPAMGMPDHSLTGWMHACLNSLPDGVAILSPVRDERGTLTDFRYTYINDAGCRICGQLRQALLGQSLRALPPDHAPADLLDMCAKVMDSGCPGAHQARSVHTRTGTVELTIINNGDVCTLTWQSLPARVAAPHLQVEHALRESEETTRALLDTTSDAALLAGTDGVVLAINPVFARFLHRRPKLAIGRSVEELLPSGLGDCYRVHAETVIRAKRRLHYEELYRGRWLDVTIHPVLDATGDVLRLAVFVRDISERKRREGALQQHTYYDQLTGLPNRFSLYDRLMQALAPEARQDSALGVLFLDLDGFKEINDELGHAVGDQVLFEAALRLQRCVRDRDAVARIGGDEFVVMLTDLPHPREDTEQIALRVLQSLGRPLYLHGKSIPISACMGIALAPTDGATPDGLIQRAELALGRAKRNGRQSFHFYADGAPSPLPMRTTLEHALYQALEQEHFVLHYQPQVRIEQRRPAIVAAEALIRWQHPELGMIPPLSFIPAIEETALSEEIGAWVLRTGARQVAAWRRAGASDLRLAVNASPAQALSSAFPGVVQEALAASDLPGNALEIEFPESLVSRDPEQLLQVTCALRELGVRVAIDDVGTGYCSVDYLQRFPLDVLKIDGSFIRHLVHDMTNAATVRNIIEYGHRYGLETIAEYVETMVQYEILQEYGCDLYQGYLFYRSLLPADLTPLLLAPKLATFTTS